MSATPLVIYVDDEKTNRLVFESAFGTQFRVKVAHSASEALALMQADTVAVVLADQRMPDVTGVELLAIVKDRYPDAIRVLVTAYSDQEPIVQAVNKIEIARFIGKPWDDGEMRALIVGALDLYFMRLRVRELELQLMSAQRSEVLGRLAAGLVHDMSNPLAAIMANVERLRFAEDVFKKLNAEHTNGDDEYEILGEMPDLARDLELSTQFLTQLVNGIREHWRPPANDGEADPRAVVEFAKRLVLSKARSERVNLKFDAPEVPRVRMAPSVVCQVVTNLLVNSIQAFNADSPKRDVTVSLQRESDGVVITVADTGKGIPPDVLARLGKEQLTTKAVGQGTGLGVMMSRALVEGAGGRFTLLSGVGQGTQARVWLPAVKTPAKPGSA
jgi:two-component system response regulator PhcR